MSANDNIVLRRELSQSALNKALCDGAIKTLLRKGDELTLPLDTGEAVTARCVFLHAGGAWFVLTGCPNSDSAGEEPSDCGDIKYATEEIYAHIAQDWKLTFRPRTLVKVEDRGDVVYHDARFLSAAVKRQIDHENCYGVNASEPRLSYVAGLEIGEYY